jgi:hypothetical protein
MKLKLKSLIRQRNPCLEEIVSTFHSSGSSIIDTRRLSIPSLYLCTVSPSQLWYCHRVGVIEGNLFLRWVSNASVLFVDLAEKVRKLEGVAKTLTSLIKLPDCATTTFSLQIVLRLDLVYVHNNEQKWRWGTAHKFLLVLLHVVIP